MRLWFAHPVLKYNPFVNDNRIAAAFDSVPENNFSNSELSSGVIDEPTAKRPSDNISSGSHGS